MKIRLLITIPLVILSLLVSLSVNSNTQQSVPELTESGFKWITEKAELAIDVDCSSASAIYIDKVIQQCQVFVFLEPENDEYIFSINGLSKDLSWSTNRALFPLNSVDWSNTTYLTAKDSNNTPSSREKLTQFNDLIIEELAIQALDKAKSNKRVLIHYILLALAAITCMIFIALNKIKKNLTF